MLSFLKGGNKNALVSAFLCSPADCSALIAAGYHPDIQSLNIFRVQGADDLLEPEQVQYVVEAGFGVVTLGTVQVLLCLQYIYYVTGTDIEAFFSGFQGGFTGADALLTGGNAQHVGRQVTQQAAGIQLDALINVFTVLQCFIQTVFRFSDAGAGAATGIEWQTECQANLIGFITVIVKGVALVLIVAGGDGDRWLVATAVYPDQLTAGFYIAVCNLQ